MSQPFYTIDLKEKIENLNLSVYEWSKNLICLSFDKKIVIAVIKFQDEFDDLDQEVEFEPVEEFYHSGRVQCLAWNPKSSLDRIPSLIEMCAAGNDHCLRFFTSDLSSKRRSKKTIEAHEDYINDSKYDAEGECLASVSDDLTCKIWKGGQRIHTFNLTSPGISVNWNAEQPERLLVAEKKGLFRVYNTATLSPVISALCSPTPLVSAAWGLRPQHIIYLASGQLHKADLKIPGHAVESKIVHPEGGYAVAVCPANENYIATAGRPNNSLKITNIKTKLTIVNTNLKLFGGFGWHNRLPILCVANNSCLNLYRISPN